MASVSQEIAPPASEKPRFPCPSCGAQYSRLEYLRRHERKHTEHRPFACSDCAKTFARSDVLLRHRRRCHPQSVINEINSSAAAAGLKAKGGRKPAIPTAKKRRVSVATSSSQEASEGSPSHDSLPTPQEPPLPTPADISLPMPLPSASSSSFTSSADLSGTLLRDAAMAISSSSDGTWSPLSPSNIGGPPPTSNAPFVSPSLLPLLIPLTGSSSTNVSANTSNQQNSTNPWVTLNATSNAIGLPPALFNLDPISTDPGLNPVWGSYPISTPPPFSDAELFAYLAGESSTANELGLNIFQPERSMMQAESIALQPRAKFALQSLDPKDRFYLPPGVFSGCYTVPHWMLPPLFKLCRIANHTLSILTSQMSIIHEPTFRLDRTHAFTAFSMCTTGTKDPFDSSALCQGLEQCGTDPWKWVSAIIRQEKSDMLVKNFARRGRMMSFAESFSLIQALIIYHVPAFLSEEYSNRMTGLLFLGSIVQIARQVGLFKLDAEWLKPVSLEGDIELRWKEWIQRETVRRTTWLVYVLDTIACIEAGIASHLTPRDVRQFPLPAPAPVWNARTAQEWAEQMRKYPVDYCLDKLLHKTFDLRTPAAPDPLTSPINADGSPNLNYTPTPGFTASVWMSNPSRNRDCLGTRLPLGPFARLCSVLTLLRGLIEFGEGKRKGGQVTQLWATKPEALEKDNTVGLETNILTSYKRAFDRWRLGWDIDRLCHTSYNPNSPSPSPTPTSRPSYSILEPNACRDSAFMHDATPYYWFGTVLMDLLRTKITGTGTTSPRPGVFGELEDEDGLDSASDARVNMFMGLDYRGMLEVARQFAHSGEGI
ncbi:hypothetical protein FRB99_006436 [Tulasnella sp. 403]|nr:hypothetical protein FRB99_006436 [Tulasnella sp. 403]